MEEQLLSRYRLVEEIGKGGMAVVYRGEDTTLNREVAIKVLHPILADREECRIRFQREAQVVAKLKHENILEIYDYSGVDSERSFIVTEYIRGRTLTSFMESREIEVPEVAALIVAEVCRAVVHAHKLGVIHRDIKPENIMIRSDGVLKLMDFGIAQIIDTQKLTLTGQLLGSPAYMAPEVVLGGNLDFRTDVFSLGVLLYRLAVGRLPFMGKNPHEVLKKIADGDHVPASVSNPAVCEDLDAIIERALELDPEDRYQHVFEMLSDLEELLKEVAILHPMEQVRRFFHDPQRFEDELKERIVEKLLVKAEQHSLTGQLPRALTCLNRVLTLDEKNPTVPELLKRLQRKKSIREAIRVTGLIAAIVAAVALGASLLFFFGRTKTPTPETGTMKALAMSKSDAGPAYLEPSSHWSEGVEEPDGGEPEQKPDQDSGTAPTRARPDRSSRPHHTARARSRTQPAMEQRVFTLVPFPRSVKVSINGSPYRDYGPSLVRLVFGPGKHNIRLTSPYCFPKEIAISAETKPGRLSPRLKWRPAMLMVRSNTPADVMVGDVVGNTGQPVRVRVPATSDTGSVKILVKVSASGYSTWRRLVTLTAGGTRTIRASLNPLK